jgi:hypothetical protein
MATSTERMRALRERRRRGLRKLRIQVGSRCICGSVRPQAVAITTSADRPGVHVVQVQVGS